jgi:hypothetical protein
MQLQRWLNGVLIGPHEIPRRHKSTGIKSQIWSLQKRRSRASGFDGCRSRVGRHQKPAGNAVRPKRRIRGSTVKTQPARVRSLLEPAAAVSPAGPFDC